MENNKPTYKPTYIEDLKNNKKLKVYYHNGEPVYYQKIVNAHFLDYLFNCGIKFIELPVDDMDFRVLKYIVNGKRRYALTFISGREDYTEHIYITESIPEDGWKAFFYDAEDQVTMDWKPKKMKSRLRLAWEFSKRNTESYVGKKYILKEANWYEFYHGSSNTDFNWIEEMEDEEYTSNVDYDNVRLDWNSNMKLNLIKCGYFNAEMIDKIDLSENEDDQFIAEKVKYILSGKYWEEYLKN